MTRHISFLSMPLVRESVNGRHSTGGNLCHAGHRLKLEGQILSSGHPLWSWLAVKRPEAERGTPLSSGAIYYMTTNHKVLRWGGTLPALCPFYHKAVDVIFRHRLRVRTISNSHFPEELL